LDPGLVRQQRATCFGTRRDWHLGGYPARALRGVQAGKTTGRAPPCVELLDEPAGCGKP